MFELSYSMKLTTCNVLSNSMLTQLQGDAPQYIMNDHHHFLPITIIISINSLIDCLKKSQSRHSFLDLMRLPLLFFLILPKQWLLCAVSNVNNFVGIYTSVFILLYRLYSVWLPWVWPGLWNYRWVESSSKLAESCFFFSSFLC